MTARFVCDSCEEQIDIDFVTGADSMTFHPSQVDVRCECGGTMRHVPKETMARLPIARAVQIAVRIVQ